MLRASSAIERRLMAVTTTAVVTTNGSRTTEKRRRAEDDSGDDGSGLSAKKRHRAGHGGGDGGEGNREPAKTLSGWRPQLRMAAAAALSHRNLTPTPESRSATRRPRPLAAGPRGRKPRAPGPRYGGGRAARAPQQEDRRHVEGGE